MAGLKIESIRFRDGTELTPGPLTVIVGPNNAGKTQTLRELVGCLTQHGPATTRVVDRVVAVWPETVEALKGTLRGALREMPDGNTYVRTLGPTLVEANSNVNLGQAPAWEQPIAQYLATSQAGGHSQLAAIFGAHFVSFLRTDDRLRLVNRTGTAFEAHVRPNLLIALYYERDAERQFDTFFHRAFGRRVRLDSSTLGEIVLRIGDNFDDVPDDPRDAVAAFGRRAPLDEQGDGMRSFAGAALGLLLGDRPIVLIDEPEAFLHPPQAVQLGEMIAELSTQERQVIVATHSADVLRGMLNRGGDFDIVRLTRKGEEASRATRLAAADVKRFANDPVLATARVIEGLFYRAAVVVEADSDSAFYNRVARQVCPLDDVLYTRAHNKQTIQKLMRPYRQLGVRAAAIADLDLLRRRDEFEPLLSSTTDDARDEPLRLQHELRTRVEERPVLDQLRELRSELSTLLAEWAVPTEETAPATLSRVRRSLKALREAASHWDAAKRHGVVGLPEGAAAVFTDLAAWCAARGIFIIPVGQLEGWLVPHGVEAAGDKSKWIVKALAKLSELENTADKEQQEPWAFIKSVHDYLLRF